MSGLLSFDILNLTYEMRESKFIFLTWFHQDGIKWKGCCWFFFTRPGFSKWQNPVNSILLSCSADIQFGGRPKPENLGDHVFYETHQKFSISVLIFDMLHIYTLHVRIQFIAGYEIHWCKMNSHLHCSARNLFIYLHQTTVLHGLLCLQ